MSLPPAAPRLVARVAEASLAFALFAGAIGLAMDVAAFWEVAGSQRAPPGTAPTTRVAALIDARDTLARASFPFLLVGLAGLAVSAAFGRPQEDARHAARGYAAAAVAALLLVPLSLLHRAPVGAMIHVTFGVGIAALVWDDRVARAIALVGAATLAGRAWHASTMRPWFEPALDALPPAGVLAAWSAAAFAAAGCALAVHLVRAARAAPTTIVP